MDGQGKAVRGRRKAQQKGQAQGTAEGDLSTAGNDLHGIGFDDGLTQVVGNEAPCARQDGLEELVHAPSDLGPAPLRHGRYERCFLGGVYGKRCSGVVYVPMGVEQPRRVGSF